MDSLEISGIRYVKASVAARRQGYTADYVGQLCRSGKIDAQRIGRAWYVRDDALDAYKDANVRSNKQKTIESAQEALTHAYGRGQIHNSLYVPPEVPEHRRRILETRVSYKEDSHPLFPQPTKVQSVEEGQPVVSVGVVLEDGAAHEVPVAIDESPTDDSDAVRRVAVIEDDEFVRPWSATIDLTDDSKDVVFHAVEVPPEEPLSEGEIPVQFLDTEEDEEPVAVVDMPDVVLPREPEAPRVSIAEELGITEPNGRAVAVRPIMSLVTVSTLALTLVIVIGSIFLQNVWVYETGVGTVAERPYFETSYDVAAVSSIIEAISR